MENEVVLIEKNEDAYIDALVKNEKKVLDVIDQDGANLSGEKLYQLTEDFFTDGVDKYIFEDLMGEDRCPILTFSDALLEKVYQKPEKLALGKSRFFESARLGASGEKYLLRKEKMDDIIVKCCYDGKNPNTQINGDLLFVMLDLVEFNASSKSIESFCSILKVLIGKLKQDLTPKGLLFKKKISDEEKEKTLNKFEKDASKVFDSIARMVSFFNANLSTEFYDRISPSSIEELFILIEGVRKDFGREEGGIKKINICYEEFLLQFINYYVSVAQSKRKNETVCFVPLSNWKLNEAFRILGEYSSNPSIQYQLIEKYAKEKNNDMIYFPFEIISDILCKSESGWDINKKCLDVIFEVAKENENEKPKIEKLVTQVVCDNSRDQRVRSEAFSNYFDLVKNDLHALVPWIRDVIVPGVFAGSYNRCSVTIASKILSLDGTDGADDGLDASRQKCVDYLKNNFENDSLEILNTVKKFLCMRSCKNSVLKEKIYGQFYSVFGNDGAKKIQFNREILDGLKEDLDSKSFLFHVCSSTLDLAGQFSDSQKSVLKDSVDYLLNLLNSGDENVVEVLGRFIFNGKEPTISKDILTKITSVESKEKISSEIDLICFSLVEKTCKKNQIVDSEYHASILKLVLDYLLHHGSKDCIDVDKKILSFLSVDFSDDQFSLAEYGKKSVNYLWEQNEKQSPLWSEIKFDYIQIISKCRSVEILQYAFEKACK